MFRFTFLALGLVTVLIPAVAFGGDTSSKPSELEGLWVPARAILEGKAFPDDLRNSIRLEIKGDAYTVVAGGSTDRGTCKVDTAKTPKTLDITSTDGPNKGRVILAIYVLNGNTLKVCYDLEGKQRPKEFKSEKGSKTFLVEYKPQKP